VGSVEWNILPPRRGGLNGAIGSLAENVRKGNPFERNGRHEETRTPDLYRVNFSGFPKDQKSPKTASFW
jgi:hypothetical protein